MRFSSNRHIDDTAKALIKSGWTYRKGSNHIVIKDCHTGFSLPVPATPSCAHAAMNWLSAVKRIKRGVRP